ncbi:MAG: DUF5666 domain-containing protein [Thiohalomonadales bacterium]
MMLANNFPSTLDSSGQTITFDEKTEFNSYVEGVKCIADITADTSLQVKGYTTASGSFYATHIVVNKVLASTQDILRVRGVIDTLSYSSFRVGRLDVYFDQHTSFVNLENRIILPGMAVVMVGAFGDEEAIVNGICENARHSPLGKTSNHSISEIDNKKSRRIFRAHSIEVLNLDVLHIDSIEVEGFIGMNGLTNEKFSINDMTVQITSVTDTPHGELSKLAAGVKVEVSGMIDRQGVLVAKNIYIERQQYYSLTGSIEAIQSGSIDYSSRHDSDIKDSEAYVPEYSLTVMATKVVIDGKPDDAEPSDTTALLNTGLETELMVTLAKLIVHDSIKITFHKNTQTGLYVLDSLAANNDCSGLAKLTGPISSVYSHGEKTIIAIAGVRVRISMALLEPTDAELWPGQILELSGRYCNTEAVFSVDDYVIKD